MLIPNHPHDERLSALAGGDPEAVADSVLSEHVASCHRCTDTVAELGALRASLAELPDLRPHRPLQLVPPLTEPSPSRVDGVGGWARRFFAPVLTAGAALAMVGLVGTTAPLLGGMASQAAPGVEADTAAEMAPDATDERDITQDTYTFDNGQGTSGGAEDAETAEEPTEVEPLQSETAAQRLGGTDSESEPASATTVERSVWPMVLFAGVALMVAAAALRWIMAPRAG